MKIKAPLPAGTEIRIVTGGRRTNARLLEAGDVCQVPRDVPDDLARQLLAQGHAEVVSKTKSRKTTEEAN